MKKAALCAVVVLALAVSAIAIGSASANNGATATHFALTYSVTGVDLWTCSGEHILKTTPIPFSKDSETCLISGDTTGYVAGTYSGSPVGYFPPFGDITAVSDDGYGLATSWTIVLTSNGDGTFTMHSVAYY